LLTVGIENRTVGLTPIFDADSQQTNLNVYMNVHIRVGYGGRFDSGSRVVLIRSMMVKSNLVCY